MSLLMSNLRNDTNRGQKLFSTRFFLHLIFAISILFQTSTALHAYQIYVAPYWPLATCEKPTSSVSFDSTTPLSQAQKQIISGYEVQLVIQNLSNMEDTEQYSVQINCVLPSQMETILSTNPSTTTKTVIGIGGQRYSSALLQEQIFPSMPIYQSAIKLLNNKIHLQSYWAIFQPLSLEVCFAYVGVGLIVSVFIWVIEEKNFNRPKVHHMYNYLEIMYDVFSSLFFTNLIHLRKFSSRIVLWFFWFTTFIFSALYQANLTQKVSESYTINELSNLQDGLDRNQKIGVLDVYSEKFYGLYPNNIKNFEEYSSTNTTASFLQMFEDISNSKIDGILMETPLADYFASLYCQMEMVDGMIWSFNYVALFGKDSLSTKVASFNSNLSKSKQTLPLSTIKTQIFDVTGLTTCQPEQEQITDTELTGLWVILVSTFALTLIVWKVLKENSEKFMKQIESFERTLMLQDSDERSADPQQVLQFHPSFNRERGGSNLVLDNGNGLNGQLGSQQDVFKRQNIQLE